MGGIRTKASARIGRACRSEHFWQACSGELPEAGHRGRGRRARRSRNYRARRICRPLGTPVRWIDGRRTPYAESGATVRGTFLGEEHRSIVRCGSLRLTEDFGGEEGEQTDRCGSEVHHRGVGGGGDDGGAGVAWWRGFLCGRRSSRARSPSARQVGAEVRATCSFARVRARSCVGVHGGVAG